MRQIKDLTGLKFGALTVISLNQREIGKIDWKCRCDCGKEIVVNATNLYRTKSCGCQRGNHIWKGHGEIGRSYFSQVKNNARKRGLAFRVSIEEIWSLFLEQNKKCALSGVELKFARCLNRDEQTASLDRIDPTKGYVKNNLIWVHKDLNCLRLDMSLTEFKNWCKLVANYEK